jgi:hypothetical protein
MIMSRLIPNLLLPSAVFCICAHAQWLNFPTPGTPRTPDGKPNLSAPSPRALNGRPDLSGIWHVHPTSLEEMKRIFGPDVGKTNVPGMEADTISKYAINILLDFKPEDSPMRPAAKALFATHKPGTNPADRCLPIGIPADGLVSEVNQVVQSPAAIVILYESDGSHRRIYTDGRALPKEIAQPSWLGYSVGHWDRDTLVVESAGFNDKTWLDLIGHPHSEALRVTERYHRPDFGHLDVEMTFDDPTFYTKPFTIKYRQDLIPDSDILETFCNENEKDRVHEK